MPRRSRKRCSNSHWRLGPSPRRSLEQSGPPPVESGQTHVIRHHAYKTPWLQVLIARCPCRARVFIKACERAGTLGRDGACRATPLARHPMMTRAATK
jgi:hypothetical protein